MKRRQVSEDTARPIPEESKKSAGTESRQKEDSDSEEEEVIIFADGEDEEASDEQSDDEVPEDDTQDGSEEESGEVDTKLLDKLSGIKTKSSKPAGTEFLDDSSEEEWDDMTKNRVGSIPMEFYDDYDHIGYNLAGQKVAKPVQKDEIRKFVDSQDDPNHWRTVRDVVNQRDVVLSKEEYQLVKTIMQGGLPQGFDPYEDFNEFEYEDKDYPLVNRPISKKAFLPNNHEIKRVRRLAYCIKRGWIKIGKTPEQAKKEEAKKLRLIWDEQEQENPDEKKKKAYRPALVAPREKPPRHAESYNPPAEYLLDDEERKKVDQLDKYDYKFIPQKYPSMRAIPLYQDYVTERFHRCLDLFMAPRSMAKKKVKKEIVIPTLPPKQSLKPFPTMESVVYLGHAGRVRSISVDPTGQWMISGSDDNTARIWEIDTGRCIEQFSFPGIVYAVAWNPDPSKNLVAVSSIDVLYIISPKQLQNQKERDVTESFMSKPVPVSEEETVIHWVKPVDPPLLKAGVLYTIKHGGAPKVLNWHGKGDYLVTCCPTAEAAKASLVVHQMSTRRSQNPFKKQKGKIQYAKFHPSKPILFIATENMIKKYNLAEQKLEQKLLPYTKFISSFDIHPKGDNLICGGYDKKVNWFDMDLSTKPYKAMNFHKYAVRKVAFHKRYPLFASCSDDMTLQVFHGMVYDDILLNPLIVPLKVLTGHVETSSLGILDCAWHPIQPWIFSSGSDSTIRLYT